MTRVRRIVANIAADRVSEAHVFYRDMLGLDVVMDMGWIVTFASDAQAPPQLSVMSEGGSGSVVPDLSIEVDDVEAVYRRAKVAGIEIVYDIVTEPWGVRRFYVRDPFGKIINILSHATS